MRTIKFRGKHIDTGKWHYGDLRQLESNCSIVENYHETRPVDPYTIGQFTNCYDAYGNEIYEGDIVVIPEDDFNGELIGIVEWHEDRFVVRSIKSSWKSDLAYCCRKKDHALKCYVRPIKVIGNIHDNPEFLDERC